MGQLSSSQATVGTSAAVLVAASSNFGQRVRVKNKGSVAIYVGNSGVTTANGLEVAAGEIADFTLAAGQALWAVSGSAGQSVHVLLT